MCVDGGKSVKFMYSEDECASMFMWKDHQNIDSLENEAFFFLWFKHLYAPYRKCILP